MLDADRRGTVPVGGRGADAFRAPSELETSGACLVEKSSPGSPSSSVNLADNVLTATVFLVFRHSTAARALETRKPKMQNVHCNQPSGVNVPLDSGPLYRNQPPIRVERVTITIAWLRFPPTTCRS